MPKDNRLAHRLPDTEPDRSLYGRRYNPFSVRALLAPELYPDIDYSPPPEPEPEEGSAEGLQTVGGMIESVQVRYKATPARSASIRFHGLRGAAKQETIDRLRLAKDDLWPELSEVIFYIEPADAEITPLLDMVYLAAAIAKGPTSYLFCGELGIDGDFRALDSPLAIGQAARDTPVFASNKGQTVVVPEASAELVASAGADVIGVRDAEELRIAIDGGAERVKAPDHDVVATRDYPQGDDLAAIKGQEKAIERLLALSPDAFEELIAGIYRQKGYVARVTSSSRDRGIDVIANKADDLNPEWIAIQCKNHRAPVGRPDAQRFLGAVTDPKYSQAILVATTGFTHDCKEFARKQGRLKLVDGQHLCELMQDLQIPLPPQQ